MYNDHHTYTQPITECPQIGATGGAQPVTSLTTEQAAQYLALSTSTLNKWRCYGTGPKFLKLGRAVRYRRLDLDAWLEAQEALDTAY